MDHGVTDAVAALIQAIGTSACERCGSPVAPSGITIDRNGTARWSFAKFCGQECRHGVSVHVTEARRRIVMERDGSRCVACNTTENLTIDHIVPVARGGRGDLDNLQVLCRSCNSLKGTGTMLDLFDRLDSGLVAP